jgi:tetratricopeptide (TPR) repeat protein
LADELAVASGSRPADEALRALDALLPENPSPSGLMVRAWLLAMLCRFEEASPIAEEARDRACELRGENWMDWIPAEIAALQGDHETAVDFLLPFCDLLEERDQRFYLSSIAPMLGRELCALGHHDEAERYARLGRELDVPQNVLGQATWRQVQALVHASRGAHAEADAFAHEALRLIDRTDGLNYQGDARCDLAEVLAAAGRTDEAVEALEQGLERYERKKNLAMVTQARRKLEALRKETPA